MHLLLLAALAVRAMAASLSTISNPIFSGFHPDPTCTFVPELNNTFFCTTSSFLMFPGLPIYASRDLVHWRHVSNALSRQEQLPALAFLARGATSGIYAPTLRYRDGTFYLMTTLAHQAIPGQNYTRWDNFIVTTEDPFDSMAWSDRVHFDFPGIDPSPDWDEESGTTWFTGSVDGTINYHVPIDLETGEAGSQPYISVWRGTGLPSPEAPHIYRKDGWLYLVLAEGGTRERHRAIMARARNYTGPWESHPNNPVLTAYQNTSSYFQAVGHADLFQDASGQWWAVALANRAGGRYAEDPYNSNFPMGRETVLTSVKWEEGQWPEFTNISGTIQGDFQLPPPDEDAFAELAASIRVGSDDVIDFEPGSSLPLHLFHWRLPVAKNYKVSPEERPGTLLLRSSRLNMTGFDGDSSRGWGQTLLARKQAHSRFRFSVDVEWEGLLTRADQEVGVTLLQDQSQHFDVGLVMLETDAANGSQRLSPHIRFRGISTTPFRLPERMKWVDDKFAFPATWSSKGDSRIRLQIEALNTTHYEFSAGLVDGHLEAEVEMEIFGHCRGNQLVPFYSGTVVGAYATSNGRYGEGSFSTYVSRWRYTGLEQITEQPAFESPITWD
ncbi:glycosyl hydrolase [Stachybotrys elegans]|uniref:Glycosyl hydrolase n=1 Tax=Stachybotrys elegans TaxID=80388 RepID=A0A8K0SI52_9HYPO|nr:glycosyl hydrolase [Stachybotrys elegans]